MNAPDPRLSEIEARLSAMQAEPWTRVNVQIRHRFVMAAPTDIAFLLTELRKRDDALDVLMQELVTREERWRLAYVAGDLTHEEASEIALEDRWVYAQLADIRAAVTATKGGGE